MADAVVDASSAGFLRKLATRTPFTQTELESACYWVKQIIALACGIVSGSLGMMGMPAFVIYLAISTAGTFLTYALIMRAPLDVLGAEGQLELFKEGGMPAFGTFLLSWILVYTFMW